MIPMPTPTNSKQINVTISGETLNMFNELMEELDLTTDAELFRIALKKMYKQRKQEKQDILELLKEELEPMIDEIVLKREKKH